MRTAFRILPLVLACQAACAGHVLAPPSAAADKAAAAAAYGLQPAMSVLLVGWYPARDFGDDTEIAYGVAVTHTYARPGQYTVTLRATDSILEQTSAVKVTVTP